MTVSHTKTLLKIFPFISLENCALDTLTVKKTKTK
jgi:hypothetical protein